MASPGRPQEPIRTQPLRGHCPRAMDLVPTTFLLPRWQKEALKRLARSRDTTQTAIVLTSGLDELLTTHGRPPTGAER